MKYGVVIAFVFVVGCSGGNSPVAPTPPPVVVVPPVVVAPPVVNPLLSDPRFSLAFYRQFVRNGFEEPHNLQPLRRQTEAPRIYLRTIYDNGSPVDAETLDTAAAALINTTGILTGQFGLAGMERGTGSRLGSPGWITIEWMANADGNTCGRAPVGGDSIRLYPVIAGCGCGRSRIRPGTVKHELGHALGYWHTDNPDDLMYISSSTCDRNPSEREIFHARVAYSMPNGSFDP